MGGNYLCYNTGFYVDNCHIYASHHVNCTRWFGIYMLLWESQYELIVCISTYQRCHDWQFSNKLGRKRPWPTAIG